MENPPASVLNEIRVFILLGLHPMVMSISERMDIPPEVVQRMVTRCRAELPAEPVQISQGFPWPVSVDGYEWDRYIGRGMMGRVYRAIDADGTPVAMKIIVPAPEIAAALPEDRFHRRETPILERLGRSGSEKDSAIVRLVTSGRWCGLSYSVSEFMPGGSLKERIAARRSRLVANGGTFRPDSDRLRREVQSAARLADGLAAVHREHVHHRDIKPANILLGAAGELKLADFGMAVIKEVEDWDTIVRSFSRDDTMDHVGSPLYWAPEVVDPSLGKRDHRSDIYSMGVVLYEAFTLLLPYRDADNLHPVYDWTRLREKIRYEYPRQPRRAIPDFPPGLQQLLFRAMEKEPARRYQNAGELARDLRRCQEADRIETNRLIGVRRWCETRQRGLRRIRTWGLRSVGVLALAIMVPLLVGWILTTLEERAIRSAMERALSSTPQDAAAIYEEIVESHEDSFLLPKVLLSLSDVRLALAQRSMAQAALVRAFVQDVDGPDGREAAIRLARTLLEEGAYPTASQVLLSIRSETLDEEMAARCDLLRAEILLARNQPAQALHLVEDLTARPLRSADRFRCELMGRVIRDYHPVQQAPLPPLEPHLSRRVVCGNFRGVGRSALFLSSKGSHLIAFRDGEFLVRPLNVPDLDDFGGCADSGDLDGDGYDELFLTVNPGGTVLGCDSVLRVFKIDLPRIVTAYRTEVPRAAYRFAVGDVDGDRRPDLLAAHGYPHRGVEVFRGLGGLRFAPMDPGEMEEVRETNSDACHVDVGDLTGDGRNEIVVSTQAYGLFSLLIYRHEAGTFQCVYRKESGFVSGGRIHDVDGDGRGEVVFGLDAAFPRNCLHRFEGFLPQGLYVADFDGARREFVLRAIQTNARLDGEIDAELPPERFSYPLCGIGSGKASGDLAVTKPRFHLGSFVSCQMLALYPLDRPLSGGIQLMRGAIGRVTVGDVDGDGDCEILVPGSERLLVYGVGDAVAPTPPSADTPRSARENLPLELRVASVLADAGRHRLAAAAYREALAEHRGREHGPAAYAGLISSLASDGRFDTCLDVIEEYRTWHPEDRLAQHRLRAEYLLVLGQVPAALREYEDIGRLSGLSEGDRHEAAGKRARLSGWERLRRVELGSDNRWLVCEPGHCRISEDGTIEYSDQSGSIVRAILPFAWRGDSFQLGFELEVSRLEFSHAVVVGICQNQPTERIPVGATFSICSTSGTPCGPCLFWSYGLGRARHRGSVPLLPQDTPLSVTLTYIEELDTLAVAIRRKDTEECLYAQQLGQLEFADDSPHFLTVGLSGQFSTAAEFKLRDLEIRIPDGSDAGPIDADLGSAGIFYRANAHLARGEWGKARSGYTRFLEREGIEDEHRRLAHLAIGVLDWMGQAPEAGLARLKNRVGVRSAVRELLHGRSFLIRDQQAEDLLAAIPPK